MAERLSNLGYFALKVEATAGTAVIPNDFIPLYKENVTSKLNLVEDNPIAGNVFDRFAIWQGQREHTGTFSVMAEPNTSAKLVDMLYTKGNVSGGGPYTYPFTVGASNSYTVDISTGNTVFRFIGAELSQLTHSFNGNEMMLDGNLSALSTFTGRVLLLKPTGTNPYTLTFDTTYDPNPSNGLVVGDIMTVTKAAGGTVNFTVATVPAGGQTITTTTDTTSAAIGDFVTLRPQTVSFTTKTPFLWARTEFRFGATASAALSAAHTPLETGSQWTLINKFESDAGAKRSGTFDPAALVRTQADAQFKIKKYFDTYGDLQQFNSITKNACVVRHFSETGYEFRVTFNNLKIRDNVKPQLNSANILYSEMDYAPMFDTSDQAAVGVSVLNNLASI